MSFYASVTTKPAVVKAIKAVKAVKAMKASDSLVAFTHSLERTSATALAHYLHLGQSLFVCN